MDQKMVAFLRLMKQAFGYARRARNCSFNRDKRPEDKCSAMAYASSCIAKSSAAQAIYWTTPELEHSELPELFTQFDVFANELFTDFETDHSRQWVDIEFNRLKELFEESVCNQPIVE